MKNLNILQWNINSFNKKRHDIQLIIQKYSPMCIGLQETNLKNDKIPSIKNYKIFYANRPDCTRASGGVASLIHSDYPSVQIPIQSDLEVIAVQVTLEFKITICNIYIPNQTPFKTSDLDNIITQLPKPFILFGDFNSHSVLWGSEKTDTRGKSIEKILDSDSIALLNNGQPTRLNPSNGTFSAIDLSISSSSLAQRISWSVLQEIYDSDHLPILMTLLSTKTISTSSTPRWLLKNPDWGFFSNLVDTFMLENPQSDSTSIDDDITFISDSITRAAEISIGKSTNPRKKNQVPWWSDEIRDSIKKKNLALKTFQISKSSSDYIKLKQLRAKTRYLVKSGKAKSWKLFSSGLGPQADPSTIWRRVRAIHGHPKNHRIQIMKDTELCTDPDEIPNLFGELFYLNSSDENYNATFLNNNIHMRNQHYTSCINPNLDEQIKLNSPIQLAEMVRATSKCTSLAPGPDGIPYCFIHNLPISALDSIIMVFNKIWSSGAIPKKWKHSIVIPIPKPNKNKFETKSYRPISLLNTMVKVLEKIIDSRLRWFLEKNNLLDPRQNGFRRHRSTSNTLHDIQAEIHSTLETKQVMGLIALDISKAYDTAWRPRILKILSNIISIDKLFNFIKNFLTDRTFQVRCNGKSSKLYTQHNGVPQGSTLSVSLFLLAINDIPQAIAPPVKCTLFADDFNLFCRSISPKTTITHLQDTLTALQDWSLVSGFSFSVEKSQCTFFTNKRNIGTTTITMNNIPIPIKKSIKILGILFDSKNTWIPHLKAIRKESLIRINTLKCFAHKSWGSHSSSLLQIYKALILSKLEYNSFLFIKAKTSALKMLDTVHNTGLRLVTGAFRSSPIPSVLNIAGVAPLDIRRVQSTMLLAVRRTQNNLRVSKQITDFLDDTHFPHSDVIKNEIPLTAPWLFNNYVNSELSELVKNDTPPIVFNQHLQSITSDLCDHTEIFTDGSRTDNGVGAAVVVKDHVSMLRLPNFCSIYSAEATAISYALDLIKTRRILKAAILSDSLSSLRSIQNPFTPNEIARKIQNQLHNLTNSGYSIILIWIPSHSQITGNERADENARQAITSPDAIKLNVFTLHDAKSLAKTITSNIWLRAWRLGSTKLNEIKHTTLTWPSPSNTSRKIETAINRLRIGHSSLTHQHLMKKEDPPYLYKLRHTAHNQAYYI
ncbi:unnamed protein product [Aphis gossypii]|uniref:RNA-directed DNA polymerase n=1 Tax=Aphis gossypii TaxID=80765 RepID=A0A9P0IXB1_APHGO|nr:unnamed protein product [Aphis gossypii]